MTNTITRQEVEDFLFAESDLLDSWQLDEWLKMWASGGDLSYQVGPTGEDDVEEVGPDTMLYLVADDRFMLEQRIIRLKKPTAHAESPRSKTRHFYTNVRILEEDGHLAQVECNLLVSRSKRDSDGVAMYPAKVLIGFEREDGNLKLRRKKFILDLERLANPGTLTIIL